jgi:protein kinase-like protein
VMEYVEGESLAVLLRRGPLSFERVIAIGRQLAAALASAHSGGIVHRDLKPANIQVMPDGSVKVLDFGVAIARASAASATTRADASVLAPSRAAQPGTPPYMSPEQLLGQTADERSDLFSLAVILFEMATGRLPVASTEPVEILMAALQTLPRADSTATRVPAPLADVIARGLATDPRERYQTAVEMGTALAQVHDDLFRTGDVPVRVPSRARRAARVLAALAGIPVFLWILGRLNSAAFNITLERSGAFAHEPQLAYITWGVRSLAAPLVQIALVIAALSALRFMLRVAALVPALHRPGRRIGAACRALAGGLSLEDPIVLAQGLTTMGLIALALTVWRFHALIRAWGSVLSTAEPSQLWPLWPESELEKVLYRATLTILLLAFSAGLLRVVHLRSRNRTRGGAGPLTALAAVLALLLLLNELPYRIMWKNAAPRVWYESMRCYVTGDDGQRLLLYCPESPPPRTRLVARGDAAVRHTGIVESIFTPSGDVR